LIDDSSLAALLGTRPFRFAPQVTSTNDIARDWALGGAPGGAVVITEEQLAGRGRFGRTWIAPPGTALLMSVILRPQIVPERIARVTMVGAVAVAEALASVPSLPLELIGLKWPNDVQLGGRKVAGILSEAVWEGQRLVATVLGIGINVRVDFDNTPLVEQATSIERVTGMWVDRPSLLAKVLARIDHWVARIGDRPLLAAWSGRLATIGQQVTIRTLEKDFSHREISGQALDVDDDGALILQTGDGATQRILAGDVTLNPLGPRAES
jgi:BirA family biotin operon repressor/biotin-[acetyl-CoA-carboxylase] ligase